MSNNFYQDHYLDLREACFTMLLHGVRYDVAEAKRLKVEFLKHKDEIKDKIMVLTGGHPLWKVDRHLSPAFLGRRQTKRQMVAEKDAIDKSNKAARKAKLAEIKAFDQETKALPESTKYMVEVGYGISNQRVGEYLYRHLGIPPYKKRREKGKITETVDDITLRKIQLKYPDTLALTSLVQQHRKMEKLLGYMKDNKVDADGRVRSFYKPFGTQPGRLSSSENPMDTGMNLQNQAGELKYLLIPDEG